MERDSVARMSVCSAAKERAIDPLTRSRALECELSTCADRPLNLHDMEGSVQ